MPKRYGTPLLFPSRLRRVLPPHLVPPVAAGWADGVADGTADAAGEGVAARVADAPGGWVLVGAQLDGPLTMEGAVAWGAARAAGEAGDGAGERELERKERKMEMERETSQGPGLASTWGARRVAGAVPHLVPVRVEAATVARESRWERPARVVVEGAGVDGERLAAAMSKAGPMAPSDDDVAVTVEGGEGDLVGISLAVCAAAAAALGWLDGVGLGGMCLMADVEDTGSLRRNLDRGPVDLTPLWGLEVVTSDAEDCFYEFNGPYEKYRHRPDAVVSGIKFRGLHGIRDLVALTRSWHPDEASHARDAVLAARRAARERTAPRTGPEGPGGDAR